MSRLLLTLTLSVVLIPAQAAPVSGQVFQFSTNGHFYIWIGDVVSWDDAATSADGYSIEISGVIFDQWHLATIRSPEENAYLWSTVLGGRSDIGEVWLGAIVRDGSVGNFEWLTGEEFVYSNFAAGQPDLARETVLEMGGAFGSMWNNEDRTLPAPGSAPQSFLIEHGAAVPIPAAFWLLGSALGVLGRMRRQVIV